MKTILFAGYKSSYDMDFCDLLNSQLERAFQLSPEPTVVLSGNFADHILRRCRSLDRCELVFDTHDAESNLWTNLKASLDVVDGPALIHLVDTPWPEPQIVQSIRNELLKEGRSDAHLIQALTPQGELMGMGFPLGLTLNGLQFLRRVKGIHSLADESIAYRWLKLTPPGQ